MTGPVWRTVWPATVAAADSVCWVGNAEDAVRRRQEAAALQETSEARRGQHEAGRERLELYVRAKTDVPKTLALLARQGYPGAEILGPSVVKSLPLTRSRMKPLAERAMYRVGTGTSDRVDSRLAIAWYLDMDGLFWTQMPFTGYADGHRLTSKPLSNCSTVELQAVLRFCDGI